MYKIDYYQDGKEKDLTYDYAYYNSLDNENTKWGNIYTYLKEKYDLCYNVESITIDVSDIKNMKYDCFSNGLLLKLYLMCNKNSIFEKCDQVTILNNCIFTEELIYNILKTDWLINEDLIKEDSDELGRRKNYFKALIEASEDRQDIKVQFRNKLYSYFIETYDKLKDKDFTKDNVIKILKLDNKEFR